MEGKIFLEWLKHKPQGRKTDFDSTTKKNFYAKTPGRVKHMTGLKKILPMFKLNKGATYFLKTKEFL